MDPTLNTLTDTLTQKDKEQIVKKMINDLYVEKLTDAELKLSIYVNEAYKNFIGEENLKLMDKLPEEFFCEKDSISFSCLFDSETSKIIEITNIRLMKLPYKYIYGSIVVSEDVYTMIEELFDDLEGLKSEAKDLKERTEDRLQKYHSKNKLIEDWSEVGKYLDHNIIYKAPPEKLPDETNKENLETPERKYIDTSKLRVLEPYNLQDEEKHLNEFSYGPNLVVTSAKGVIEKDYAEITINFSNGDVLGACNIGAFVDEGPNKGKVDFWAEGYMTETTEPIMAGVLAAYTKYLDRMDG